MNVSISPHALVVQPSVQDDGQFLFGVLDGNANRHGAIPRLCEVYEPLKPFKRQDREQRNIVLILKKVKRGMRTFERGSLFAFTGFLLAVKKNGWTGLSYVTGGPTTWHFFRMPKSKF